MDDTVDEFGNLATGVAQKLAKHDYTSEKYKQFHKTILYVYTHERQLYNKLSSEEKDGLCRNIADKIEELETQIELKRNKFSMKNEITEENDE